MIVVVGAGLAGLACADRLRRAGVDVQVYEAAERVGGRCWTLRGHFSGGRHAERGAQLVDSGDSALLSLLDELEIPVVDLQAVMPPGAAPRLWIDGAEYPLEEAAKHFADVQPAIRADLLATGPRPGHADATTRAVELDRLSISDYLESIGAARRLRRFLEVAYTWELGADATELSALHLVTLLGRSPEGEFELFGPGDARYAIPDGVDRIAERLAERVGDRVNPGAELVAVRRDDWGRFVLTFQRGVAVQDVPADQVVLALPFSVLRASVDISRAGFSPLKTRAIGELPMGGAVRTHLEVVGRPWLASGCDGATVSDTGYQTCWEETLGVPGETSILVNLRSGADATRPVPPDALIGEIDKVISGVAAAWTGGWASFDWSAHPWSLGCYAFYRPGQFTAFAGEEARQEGACHFAGEHTSPFDSGMNGAVASGWRAAAEVLT
ncbi:flavin monoamine oxidase family protein [Nonomuraea sp. SYSU D8015]|uniref:flavin monoamine oxidase family protein n=1 Tax=Nonomuraea sp. SYSU D8015 TaxID=2593644 RepID=UPI0016615A9D|nr:NAD(P)/FAD-dependent oxidoreductase [Nonomuraea sp. SYSU D8015]